MWQKWQKEQKRGKAKETEPTSCTPCGSVSEGLSIAMEPPPPRESPTKKKISPIDSRARILDRSPFEIGEIELENYCTVSQFGRFLFIGSAGSARTGRDGARHSANSDDHVQHEYGRPPPLCQRKKIDILF